MRRRSSVLLSSMLLTVLSVGVLISCTENKPASSTTALSKGTVKVIPSNMMGDSDDLNGGAGGGVGRQAPGTVTRVYNPTAQQASGGASTPSRLNDPLAQQRPAATPPVDNSELPDAPAGAQWTLYCQTISGAGHVER